MSDKTERDVFLLLTITGLTLCFVLMVLAGFYVMDDWRSIWSEIVAMNFTAIIQRGQTHLLLSISGGIVFLGTLFCYRRYHKLTFGSDDPSRNS